MFKFKSIRQRLLLGAAVCTYIYQSLSGVVLADTGTSLNLWSDNAHATLSLEGNFPVEPEIPDCPPHSPPLRYYVEINDCAFATWRKQNQSQSCYVGEYDGGIQTRTRRRPIYQRYATTPPYASYETAGQWEPWSEWTTCFLDCSPYPNYNYNALLGGCVFPAHLRKETQSRDCFVDDHPKKPGKQERSRRYRDYFVIAPPEWRSTVASIILSEWSEWSECKVPKSEKSMPSVPPRVGTRFNMSGDLICTRNDNGYDFGMGTETAAGKVNDAARQAIIDAYKALASQRCPEFGPESALESYPYWVAQVGHHLMGLGTPALTQHEATAWVQKAIKSAGSPETLNDMHVWCQQTANQRYGSGVMARFIKRGSPGYTGNTCEVTEIY